MVNLTINNRKLSVPEGTTIMAAAASIGINIPHLCYLKEINEIAACRVQVAILRGNDLTLLSHPHSAPDRPLGLDLPPTLMATVIHSAISP